MFGMCREGGDKTMLSIVKSVTPRPKSRKYDPPTAPSPSDRSSRSGTSTLGMSYDQQCRIVGV